MDGTMCGMRLSERTPFDVTGCTRLLGHATGRSARRTKTSFNALCSRMTAEPQVTYSRCGGESDALLSVLSATGEFGNVGTGRGFR